MTTSIAEAFNAQPWAKQLARRKPNFEFMCCHMGEMIERAPYIVETGTAWDKGNWAGQGQSTLIWDWLAGVIPVSPISIDIRKEASETAASQTTRVVFETGDSINVLSKFYWPEKIGLLYLDSFDWTEELNLESSFHHVMELASVFASLPPGCLIVVDDRHGDMKGKHWLVEAFMTKLEIKPAFKGHQIGWIKPW